MKKPSKMSVCRNEYKQISKMVTRFGKGLSAIFNTRRRADAVAFTQAFNRAASPRDRFKLGALAMLHSVSEHLPSGDGWAQHIQRRHAELLIPIAVRAFGHAVIAEAIAPEDRHQRMRQLCQRVGAKNLAGLIQASL